MHEAKNPVSGGSGRLDMDLVDQAEPRHSARIDPGTVLVDHIGI